MKEGYVCNYLGLFHVKMPFIDGLSAVKIIKMRNIGIRKIKAVFHRNSA